MDSSLSTGGPRWPRRDFLRRTALFGLASAVSWNAAAEDSVTLPFVNGERPLVKYPQKRPLIRVTSRPPQLETPFSVFGEGPITPNDAFFVRYHLANIPLEIDPDTFRVAVKGAVKTPLSLSLQELKTGFEAIRVVAVNQCSGNSRGFFDPRVTGGQLGNGAMGNAEWTGVRLKDVLEKAGLEEGTKQIAFNGLDQSVVPQTPDFIKALDVDHAMAGEVMLAYAMNGEPLPMLNGFPVRLVVPGYYGTYWIKHLNEIQVLKSVFDGFWMSTAYRIPNTPGACVPPGTTPKSTVPIARLNVRSFVTSHVDGATLPSQRESVLRGIAFDGGSGIAEVVVSTDGGSSWREATLGKDLGNYSFREWSLPFTPKAAGPVEVKVKATNRLGDSQPMQPLWNPSGYMRNVVETTKLAAAANSTHAMSFSFRSAAILVAGITVTAAAAPVKIELPTETPLFKPGPGSELVTTNCLTCHSSEYITIQPPLARPAWKASVEKMQKKFGAPIPADQVDALVEYIVKTYGTERADVPDKVPAGRVAPAR